MSEKPQTASVLEALDWCLTWTSRLLGGAALAFMTCFSVWNVLVMRKAMNAPIVGAEDLLLLSLVAIVALSIPLGARTGAHIEIEVLEDHMPAWFAKWSMVGVKVLGVVLLSFMAWRLWHAGQSAQRFGETTQQLLISFEPFYYLLAVSALLYALILLLDIRLIVQGRKIATLKTMGDAL